MVPYEYCSNSKLLRSAAQPANTTAGRFTKKKKKSLPPACRNGMMADGWRSRWIRVGEAAALVMSSVETFASFLG